VRHFEMLFNVCGSQGPVILCRNWWHKLVNLSQELNFTRNIWLKSCLISLKMEDLGRSKHTAGGCRPEQDPTMEKTVEDFPPHWLSFWITVISLKSSLTVWRSSTSLEGMSHANTLSPSISSPMERIGLASLQWDGRQPVGITSSCGLLCPVI
jgi:hypothetical protein